MSGRTYLATRRAAVAVRVIGRVSTRRSERSRSQPRPQRSERQSSSVSMVFTSNEGTGKHGDPTQEGVLRLRDVERTTAPANTDRYEGVQRQIDRGIPRPPRPAQRPDGGQAADAAHHPGPEIRPATDCGNRLPPVQRRIRGDRVQQRSERDRGHISGRKRSRRSRRPTRPTSSTSELVSPRRRSGKTRPSSSTTSRRSKRKRSARSRSWSSRRSRPALEAAVEEAPSSPCRGSS